MPTDEKWMRSGEARRVLRGDGCDLMHLREAGKLRFQKQGNVYLYAANDVRQQAAERGVTKNVMSSEDPPPS